MIRIALALAVVVAVMASAAAEELITAPDGKLIRLKGDGTWEYVVDREGNPVRRAAPLGQAEPTAIRRIAPRHAPAALAKAAPAGAVALRIVALDRGREGACFVTVAAFNNSAARLVRFYPRLVVLDRNNAALGHLEPKFQELHAGRARYLELPVHAADCDRIAAARLNGIYACRMAPGTQEVTCGMDQRAHALPDGVVPLIN